MTTGDASQPDNAPLAALVETLLAGLPPALAAAVRLAAVPRQLTDATLTLLLAEQMAVSAPAVTVDAVKATLVSTHLARQDGATLTFHPELRTALLQWWRQHAPEQFVAHNRRLLDFWRDKARTSPTPEDTEIVYHALAVDAEAGRVTLLTTFETALDYFQVEQAEALVAAARTLTPWLNEPMLAWLDYCDGRILLAARRGDRGQAIFTRCAAARQEDGLAAVARWSLGQLAVQNQQWQEGIRLQRAALAALPPLLTPIYRARILLSLGDAFADLAEYSGGLAAERVRQHSGLLSRFAELPYLAYRRAVRAVSLLPNWYFGANYEVWVIAYLQKRATRYYGAAETAARRANAAIPELAAQLANANLLHRLGRWRRAWQRLARLRTHPAIQTSRYRTAHLQRIEGEALAVEGKWTAAAASLETAAATFRAYADPGALALTQFWLARVQQMTTPVQSPATYREAIQHFAAAGDLTAATLALGELEGDTPAAVSPTDAGDDLLPERHYLTRFPAAFLRNARRLALYVALPVSLGVGMLLTLLALIAMVTFLEGIVRLQLAGASFAAVNSIGVLLAVLFCLSPLLAFWLYQGIYCGVGYAMISAMGRSLAAIEHEPPDRIVVTQESLTYVAARREETTALPWAAVTRAVSAEVQWRRRPLHLLSRLFLADGVGGRVTIQAVTLGYAHLRRTLETRLAGAGSTAPASFDLNLTAPRALLATLFLTLARLLSAAPYFHPDDVGIEQLDGAIVAQEVTFSPWLREFVIGFLLIFLLVTLWRLVWRRRQWRRVAPELAPLTPTWLLWLAALLQTAIVLASWFGLRPA
jgi:hypothetical protein